MSEIVKDKTKCNKQKILNILTVVNLILLVAVSIFFYFAVGDGFTQDGLRDVKNLQQDLVRDDKIDKLDNRLEKIEKSIEKLENK